MKAEIASWKPDAPKVSKFAENLVQLNNGVKISPDPKKWKCCKCDLCENLWLNLSDGSLLCGRKNWDGSGQGSNFILEKNQTLNFYKLVLSSRRNKNSEILLGKDFINYSRGTLFCAHSFCKWQFNMCHFLVPENLLFYNKIS